MKHPMGRCISNLHFYTYRVTIVEDGAPEYVEGMIRAQDMSQVSDLIRRRAEKYGVTIHCMDIWS